VDAANPERRNKGKISRIGGELDSRTARCWRKWISTTARCEFIAGSYVNVTLLIPAISYVEVPARRWWCATEELRRGRRWQQPVKLCRSRSPVPTAV